MRSTRSIVRPRSRRGSVAGMRSRSLWPESVTDRIVHPRTLSSSMRRTVSTSGSSGMVRTGQRSALPQARAR